MFLIIDGSSLAHSAYYASIPFKAGEYVENEQFLKLISTDSYGRFNNCINGFFDKMLSLLNSQRPTHFAVCFDKNRMTTFRKLIYAPYKANRGVKPFPLAYQLDEIKKMLKAVGVPVLESEKYEADDFAGSLSCQFSPYVDKTVLYTKDKDYFQLINDSVAVWIPCKDEEMREFYEQPSNISENCFEYNEDTLYEIWGLTPAQITDWKGVSGDPSDNIPGIKGVSDKSIVPLLNKYGSLENIYRELDALLTKEDEDKLFSMWKEEGLMKRSPIKLLREHKQEAFFFKELATIKTNVFVGNLKDYELKIDYKHLWELLRSYDLHELDILMGCLTGF